MARITIAELAEQLGKNPDSVRNCARRLKLGSGRPRALTPREARLVTESINRGPGNPKMRDPKQAAKLGSKGGKASKRPSTENTR